MSIARCMCCCFTVRCYRLDWSDNSCLCVLQLDAIDSTGLIIPVSVWVRKLDIDDVDRCVVVMEPVERSTASVTFDSSVSVSYNITMIMIRRQFI